MTDNKWEEVVGEQGKFVRWTEEENPKAIGKTVYVGTVIEGVYMGKQEGIGENSATLYKIKTAEHGLLSVWSTTVLADKFASIQEGSEVRIEKTGEQKPKAGGKAYFTFKVFSRQAPMVEVKPDERSIEDKVGDEM